MNNNSSLKEKAYNQIAEWILNDTLKPGEVITEIGLAEKLGMSRTPIREAIQRLSQEELVTIVPRVGVFVSQLNMKSLKELFEVREATEGMMTRLACIKGSQKIFEELRDSLVKADKIKDNSRTISLERTGDRIHDYIISASDNSRLKRILDTYRMQIVLERRVATKIPGRVERSKTEHLEIVTNCINRNCGEAENAMKTHIRSTLESIVAAYGESTIYL